jgi:hypothetical protein
MHHSGAFDSQGTADLVTRGRPVECESVQAVRRMAAAATAVQVSTLLQGKDVASNVIHFIKAAAGLDATVLDKLAAANLFPYDKSLMMPMWIMVRPPLASLAPVSRVVSSRSKQLKLKCHYFKRFEFI